MDKITASPTNPNPNVLHALSCMLETQESRYMEEIGYMPSYNSRASHNTGSLGTLLRENNEFFELISNKYLLETRYSISVRAAALRLFLGCSFTWTYPHVFDENILEKIKGWVIEENVGISNGVRNDKCGIGKKTSSDFKMLKTYSTGLLAVALIGGGPVVEDVLSSGLASNLMRYLRNRVLGDTNTSQRYAAHQADKNVNTTVIDAANATDISGSSRMINAGSVSETSNEPDLKEEIEEYFIRDKDTLAILRDKYSIQCIEILGEYVEVLGPVLHEKGVDVCLALLHRCLKVKEPSKVAVLQLLPDVLNLICALSAHRKFSALFVDRGGMQKLLSVPRISQTFVGLSSCLFTIGSHQGIMERVCTLHSDIRPTSTT